jgi:hypothetical protein
MTNNKITLIICMLYDFFTSLSQDGMGIAQREVKADGCIPHITIKEVKRTNP